MVGRTRFALERWDSPRHSSHVAQLFSLGHTTLMDTPTPIIYYIYPIWFTAPYLGLVLASIWFFKRAPKAPAWLMLVGSAVRGCDMFVKQFVLTQGIGFWPMKGDVSSPEAFKILQLQQNIWTFFDKAGSLGMLLFVIGLLLFAWRFRTGGSRVA